MKITNLILASSLLLLFSCESIVDQPPITSENNLTVSNKDGFKPEGLPEENSNLRIYDTNDPNLQPWVWWNNEQIPYGDVPNISAYLLVGQQVINRTIPVPWQTPGNIHANQDPDVRPSKGWILAYRDFGTQVRPVDHPIIALYNKRLGVLRFFIFNTKEIASPLFRAELKFTSPNYTSSNLSFTAEPQHSMIPTDLPGETQSTTFTSEYTPTYGGWFTFDFSLINYDPAANHNTWISLRLLTIDQKTFTSTNFTLESFYANNYLGGSSSANNLYKAQQHIKSYDDLRKSIKDSNFFSQSVKNFLDNNSYVQSLPILGSALGVISLFAGGKTSYNPNTLVNFKGSLSLESKNETYKFTEVFSLKSGGTLNQNRYQPYSNVHFGIFNFTTKPNFTENLTISSTPDPYDSYLCEFTANGNFTLQNPNLIINPNLDMTLISKKIQLVGDYGNSSWVTLTTNPSIAFPYFSGPSYGGPNIPAYSGFAVELIFKVNGSNEEIVFYKFYKGFNQVFINHSEQYSC